MLESYPPGNSFLFDIENNNNLNRPPSTNVFRLARSSNGNELPENSFIKIQMVLDKAESKHGLFNNTNCPGYPLAMFDSWMYGGNGHTHILKKVQDTLPFQSLSPNIAANSLELDVNIISI